MVGTACVGRSDIFFPQTDLDGNDYWLDKEAAIALCEACPFELRCRDYALLGKEDGIWGATDPDERRKLRAKNNKTIHELVDAIRPAITNVAATYVFAQEALNVKDKMQALQSSGR